MEDTKMNGVLITENDMRVIVIRGIIKVVVKIIIGIGIVLLFLSYTLTFAQDILEKDYNAMPQTPNSLKGVRAPQGAVVREKSTKSPSEWEPGDPIHVPLFGGMEGTVRWRNKDTPLIPNLLFQTPFNLSQGLR